MYYVVHLFVSFQRKVRAQEIYRCHVETGASDPVNVDSQARSITEEGLETSAPELFDVAKKQVTSHRQPNAFMLWKKLGELCT